MRITDVLWKEYFVDKIESKHNVRVPEVEDLLLGQPHFRKMEKGKMYMLLMGKPQQDVTLQYTSSIKVMG